LNTLAPGQWLNDTMIEFHMEFLERTFVPKDANYLFLRPSMVHLITFAEGKKAYNEAKIQWSTHIITKKKRGCNSTRFSFTGKYG
jgi:hypothetical protein